MKKYKVTVSKQANQRLREIFRYLTHKIKSQQAAQAVLDDYRRTRARLEDVGGSLKLDDDPDVAARGYHRIHFDKHRYFLLYKIDGENIEVANIYHDLEDYKGKIIL